MGDRGRASQAIMHARARERFRGDTKQCNKCDKWKPLAAYGVSAKGLGGVTAVCSECRRRSAVKTGRPTAVQRSLEYARLNTTDSHKRCRICREWKPYSEYYKAPKSRGGVRATCKVCCAKKSKRYYHEIAGNDERWAEISKRLNELSKQRAAEQRKKRIDDAMYYLDDLYAMGYQTIQIQGMTGLMFATLKKLRDRNFTNVYGKTVKVLQEAHDHAVSTRRM